MKENQRVIVLTGAAGTGKTTVQDYLKQTYDIPRIITHTTRNARVGEQNGVDYYFEDQSSFANLHLLEAVDYSGKRYGSSWEGIERALSNNQLASIVLDTKGAITYQEKLGKNVVILFITVDNQNDLKTRMLKRGDDLSEVEKRMKSKEANRDFKLPEALKKTANVLKNENWENTKRQVDQFVENLKND